MIMFSAYLILMGKNLCLAFAPSQATREADSEVMAPTLAVSMRVSDSLS